MHVDGFRFDLASTLGPRAARSRQAGGVFRHHPSGPGHLAGEADRRAVGSGRRRLSGRQLSRVVVGMERQISRLHPAVLERRRRHGFGIRHAVLRIERFVRMEQPPAARQHQLRHLPRWLHAARPGLLRPQAQRGQRRGQSRRNGRQHQLELRRRRPDRRSEDQCLARAKEAQLAGHAAPFAGRADAAGRRRNRPHAEGQQQRLLPGQRDHLAQLGFDARTGVAAQIHAHA